MDTIWARNQHSTIYGQQLGCQILVRFSIDLAKQTEPICSIPTHVFPGQLIIQDKKKLILKAKAKKCDLKPWCNGSKLKNKGIRAAVIWKTDGVKKEWYEQKVGLGFNKEIFDAEIWGILKALKVVEQKAQQIQEFRNINIFCDS